MWVWEPLVRCLLARGNTRNVDKMKRSYTIYRLYLQYYTNVYQRTLLLISPCTHCVLHCLKGTEQMLWTDFLRVLTL